MSIKTFFLLLTVFSGVSANVEWSRFTTFQSRFEKKYEDIKELTHRFNIFNENVKDIEFHNKDTTQNYTKGINQFTDLTPDEFKLYVRNSGLLSTSTSTSLMFGLKCDEYKSSVDFSTLPDKVDLREQYMVTPVKDQGQCGSCWSFSATGAMESAHKKSTQNLVSLSEQELVDCSKRYMNLGCSGGDMSHAFFYVIDNGLCSESDYPYTAKDGTCQSSTCNSQIKLKGCYNVPANNQQLLKDAVMTNAVSIAIEADTAVFQSYKSGVITSKLCGTTLDHGVLIVGYGVEDGIKYWLVKNSWGPSWGDNGYIKLERSDLTNDPGVCGVSMQPTFPIHF